MVRTGAVATRYKVEGHLLGFRVSVAVDVVGSGVLVVVALLVAVRP